MSYTTFSVRFVFSLLCALVLLFSYSLGVSADTDVDSGAASEGGCVAGKVPDSESGNCITNIPITEFGNDDQSVLEKKCALKSIAEGATYAPDSAGGCKLIIDLSEPDVADAVVTNTQSSEPLSIDAGGVPTIATMKVGQSVVLDNISAADARSMEASCEGTIKIEDIAGETVMTCLAGGTAPVTEEAGGTAPVTEEAGGTAPLTPPASTKPKSSSGASEFINPINVDSIPKFFLAIVDIILIIAAPIIVLFIMYGGFLYATARGNPEQLTTAKNALLWAIIGGVIVLGARLISEVISNTIKGLTG